MNNIDLGRAIYERALSDRRGFRSDQIGIEDAGIWEEIYENIGSVARALLADRDEQQGAWARPCPFCVVDEQGWHHDERLRK